MGTCNMMGAEFVGFGPKRQQILLKFKKVLEIDRQIFAFKVAFPNFRVFLADCHDDFLGFWSVCGPQNGTVVEGVGDGIVCNNALDYSVDERSKINGEFVVVSSVLRDWAANCVFISNVRGSMELEVILKLSSISMLSGVSNEFRRVSVIHGDDDFFDNEFSEGDDAFFSDNFQRMMFVEFSR